MLSCLRLYTYELPVNPGSSFRFSTRRGMILESPEHGVFAEASPLPGYSHESYEEALAELSTHLHSLLSLASFSHDVVVCFCKKLSLSPSVTFAVYSLLQQIHAPQENPLTLFLRRYIDIPYQDARSCDHLVETLMQLPPHEVVKVKVGSYPVDSAIDVFRSLLKFQPRALHLDINQKWSIEESLRFASSFEQGSFLSLEDPVSHASDLWRFAKHSSHPLSLDQLLRTASIYELLTLPHLKSCEFKPTLDMPLLLEGTLLHHLRTLKIDYTFSSCYETSVGLAAIGRLGLQLRSTPYLGIDTLGVFAQDLLATPLERRENMMILSSPYNFNPSLLTLYETASVSYR